MTSVVAWQREVGALSELVIASDSRLGGGEDWDACAKIFDIGRDDAVLAFAGDTWRALPLVLQAVATTRSYRGSSLRTLDLPKFAGHIERVLNAVLGEARGVAAKERPGCEFLLGGWSWSMAQFRVYKYSFDRRGWRFRVHSAANQLPTSIRGAGRGRLYATIGDASTRLTGRLARGYNLGTISGPLDYHPLEQLYQQTIDTNERSVGGAVQVSKVYKSIRVENFVTQVSDEVSVSGRPLLSYENVDLRTIARHTDGSWTTKADRAPSVPD